MGLYTVQEKSIHDSFHHHIALSRLLSGGFDTLVCPVTLYFETQQFQNSHILPILGNSSNPSTISHCVNGACNLHNC